jgi:Core-2/I-Branching enzyme
MAYVIICHKNSKQVNLLIEMLNDGCVDFFVHVDIKSSIQSDIVKLDNVNFIKNPIKVTWGHYSQIECILRCFSSIKEHGYYNYVNIISGQDIPLVSNNTIIKFFKESKDKEFVGYIDMTNKKENKDLYARLCIYYPDFLMSNKRYLSFITGMYGKFIMPVPFLQRSLKALPNKLYKGSNWLSITGNCMKYILDYTENTPKYVDFFKHTFCADEIFFQTIILNSKFRENVINDNKRYVDWTTGPGYPRTLTIKDFDRIHKKKEEQLWGRKFNLDVDNEIVEVIIREIDSIS